MRQTLFTAYLLKRHNVNTSLLGTDRATGIHKMAKFSDARRRHLTDTKPLVKFIENARKGFECLSQFGTSQQFQAPVIAFKQSQVSSNFPHLLLSKMDLIFASEGPAAVTTPSVTSFIDHNLNGAHRRARNQHASHDLQRVVDSGTVRTHPESGHTEESTCTSCTERPDRPNR